MPGKLARNSWLYVARAGAWKGSGFPLRHLQLGRRGVLNWYVAHCPSPERRASYSNISARILRSARVPSARFRVTYRTPLSPVWREIPRNPAGIPRSRLRAGSTTRWTSSFLALRRSKAFLLQHLGANALLVMPIYATILAIAGLLVAFSGKLLRVDACESSWSRSWPRVFSFFPTTCCAPRRR